MESNIIYINSRSRGPQSVTLCDIADYFRALYGFYKTEHFTGCHFDICDLVPIVPLPRYVLVDNKVLIFTYSIVIMQKNRVFFNLSLRKRYDRKMNVLKWLKEKKYWKYLQFLITFFCNKYTRIFIITMCIYVSHIYKSTIIYYKWNKFFSIFVLSCSTVVIGNNNKYGIYSTISFGMLDEKYVQQFFMRFSSIRKCLRLKIDVL